MNNSNYLTKNARALRKRSTRAEKLLWNLLRDRSLSKWKFRRQHPIPPFYILDFFCAETKVAVELDGRHHKNPEQAAADSKRTAYLSEMGIRVIRFTNEEMLVDPGGVLRKIVEFSPCPLPALTQPSP